MRIRLAFTHTAPGKGEIRAYCHGRDALTVLTVGDYYSGPRGQWTARLWKTCGDSSAVARQGIVTADDVAGLSRAAYKRGVWWT